MKEALFSLFLTLGILFLFIAGISGNNKGFKTALILATIFLYLAYILR